METFTIFSCEASEVVFDLLMFDYFYGFLLNTYTAFRREKQLTKDQYSFFSGNGGNHFTLFARNGNKSKLKH